MTSLHDAAKTSKTEEVKTLIATGHDVNQIDKLKRTPLHLAAWSGDSEICLLLIRSQAQLTAKAQDAFTAVHFASQSSNSAGSAECIKVLVKKDKKLLNMCISKGNKTALHLAVAKGNEHAISTLIELGADTKAVTTTGQLPVDMAKSDAIRSLVHAKIAEKLLEVANSKCDEEEKKGQEGQEKKKEEEEEIEDVLDAALEAADADAKIGEATITANGAVDAVEVEKKEEEAPPSSDSKKRSRSEMSKSKSK